MLTVTGVSLLDSWLKLGSSFVYGYKQHCPISVLPATNEMLLLDPSVSFPFFRAWVDRREILLLGLL